MLINSIFTSLEGECHLSGVPTLFVRTQGCDFKCVSCDTKESWDISEGQEKSVSEVLSQLESILDNNPTIRKVSFTGGNPLLQIDEIREICKALRRKYLHTISINLEHPGIDFRKEYNISEFNDHIFELMDIFSTITLDIKLHLLNHIKDNSAILKDISLFLIKLSWAIRNTKLIPKIIVNTYTVPCLVDLISTMSNSNTINTFDYCLSSVPCIYVSCINNMGILDNSNRKSNLTVTAKQMFDKIERDKNLVKQVIHIISTSKITNFYFRLNVQLHKLLGLK